ncbi:ATP-dependent acyl-CoA ligase, partial [Rhodococcus hoagii]|nr:ATP-dependent acyl-CoA ligase [Prescottella equi]
MPSSFRDDVTGALPLPDPMTIPALLLDRAARAVTHRAARVEATCDGVTYRELVDRAGAMAGSLARRGIRRGDPVAAMTT